ncbi:MAG: RsmB/NOP family class I SAM-dependent RNA methyltransferase, partial [Duodenibacillus sp.]|nr:RsmB/NOP family class I SAM-dependent RNA methyltransferase [Duodenibacillus sp.]
MPFSPVRHKPQEALGGKRLTERQQAARKRQLAENRAARPEKGPSAGPRMQKADPGRVRVTGLIVSELARAFAVILKLDGPADQLMKAFFKSNPSLGARDRALIAEAIYYGLRHFGSIAWRMAPVRPDRAPRAAALLTLALQHGAEAVGDTVWGSEKGAVANMLAAKLDKAPPEVRAEMPFWLYERLEAQYGADAPAIFAACCAGAPLDLRVNALKATREAVIAELAESRIEARPTAFSPDGLRLTEKPGLIRWPVYQEGRVDVQDEGSQLIARLVAPRRREMVCDFCAGAGGKTLALGALMHSTGRLYAFDVNEKRLAGMTPRMRRAGLSNVYPMVIRDEHDLRVRRLKGKFHRVLVDAPCTGTGTLRRNPDLKWRLDVSELERINAVQKSVLEEASRLVKDGGRLVYATCSLLRQENQDVVEAFLAAHPEFSLVDATEELARQQVALPAWQSELAGGYFVMLPHKHGTDGFFAAALQKAAPARPGRKPRAGEDAGQA